MERKIDQSYNFRKMASQIQGSGVLKESVLNEAVFYDLKELRRISELSNKLNTSVNTMKFTIESLINNISTLSQKNVAIKRGNVDPSNVESLVRQFEDDNEKLKIKMERDFQSVRKMMDELVKSLEKLKPKGKG